MSGLSPRELGSPNRLELTWYLTDHPPKPGSWNHRSQFNYHGNTYVDNICLVTDLEQVQLREWVEEKRTTWRENDIKVDSTMNELTDVSWRDS